MYLEKGDIRIYCEVSGKGEPLLLIHGMMVDAEFYKSGARLLSAYFQVITYDRRDYSRSVAAEREGVTIPLRFHSSEEFLAQQAEDIKDLLDTLSVNQAYVFGASQGALIGQYFLLKYPERVKHLIMYEPAMLGMLFLEDKEIREWARQTLEIVEKRRFNKALLRLAESMGEPDPRSPAKSEKTSLREFANMEHALLHEMPVLMGYTPDIEKLKEYKNKITIAAGERSRGTGYWRVAEKLSEMIGSKEIFYPGGHNLPFDLPYEFAFCVLGTLMLKEKKNDE